ncbi:MAG: NADH-quinone oxidoreductase subunit H [Candidatus Omnitrophica bacterium]|nr:NADH-quinone oxidoreductase subunit H [Candidatus Omnitrophota bacterium]MDD5671089.1 NADH-quinone oxidoreductase subunit H [Candidatus Omnitrophota bacterium]
MIAAWLNFLIVLFAAPFLLGIVNRTKAFFAGRRGPPLLQLYYDLAKLLRKSAVISRTTGFIFWLGPVAGLAAVFCAAMMVPFGNARALVAFNGDLILFAYLLGLMRFFTVIAALDTGSAFEGMGASREVQFAVLAEPALFLGLAALTLQTGHFSLSDIYASLTWETWGKAGPTLALIAAALLIVFLAENCRVPVDDPKTHLELTMIHEVMVLDHSGPDFAAILYSAALKFWILGMLIVRLAVPVTLGHPLPDGILFLSSMVVLAVLIGIIESVMARLRLTKVPQLLIVAIAFSILALILEMR